MGCLGTVVLSRVCYPSLSSKSLPLKLLVLRGSPEKRGAVGSQCVMGTEFPSGKTDKFWRQPGTADGCTQRPWTVRSDTATVVNSVFACFTVTSKT